MSTVTPDDGEASTTRGNEEAHQRDICTLEHTDIFTLRHYGDISLYQIAGDDTTVITFDGIHWRQAVKGESVLTLDGDT